MGTRTGGPPPNHTWPPNAHGRDHAADLTPPDTAGRSRLARERGAPAPGVLVAVCIPGASPLCDRLSRAVLVFTARRQKRTAGPAPLRRLSGTLGAGVAAAQNDSCEPSL